MPQNLNKKQTGVMVLIIAVSFFVGVHVGANKSLEIDKVTLANKNTQVATQADFEPFWKVWNTINEKYPSADKVTDQARVYGAISGLVSSLDDPYSVFFSPDEAKSFEEQINGNFTGIGIEIGMKDKILTVIAPLKDTPAYRANLKPGDKILKIDQKVTSDMKIEDAIKLMRGAKGTSVTLTIFRDGVANPFDVKIVRDTIEIPTIKTELRKDGIFVITLYSFDSKSASLFRNAIQDFAKSKSNKLIIDLRGNPGGYLDSAVDIASWFLPTGKTVVTEDYGADKDPVVFRSKGYTVVGSNVKIAVLMDGGSASASEIVAGALQDNGRAKLVGDQSYGKGSVQEPINITPDTLLKITVAKWLTPNGTSISLKGLTPDYPVSITPKDVTAKKDPQLDKAAELLLGGKI